MGLSGRKFVQVEYSCGHFDSQVGVREEVGLELWKVRTAFRRICCSLRVNGRDIFQVTL